MRKVYPLSALLVLLAVAINSGSAQEGRGLGTKYAVLDFELAKEGLIYWDDTNLIVPGPGIVAGEFGWREKTELYLKMLFMPNKARTARILYAYDFTKMEEAERHALIDTVWQENGLNTAAVFIYAPEITGMKKYGFYGTPLVKLAHDKAGGFTDMGSVEKLKAALNSGAPKNLSLSVLHGVPVYFAIDIPLVGAKEAARLIAYDYGGAFEITKRAALSGERDRGPK